MVSIKGAEDVRYLGDEVPTKGAFYGMKEGEETLFFIQRNKIYEYLAILQSLEKELAEADEKNVEEISSAFKAFDQAVVKKQLRDGFKVGKQAMSTPEETTSSSQVPMPDFAFPS